MPSLNLSLTFVLGDLIISHSRVVRCGRLHLVTLATLVSCNCILQQNYCFFILWSNLEYQYFASTSCLISRGKKRKIHI